jgi:hypothetical protein
MLLAIAAAGAWLLRPAALTALLSDQARRQFGLDLRLASDLRYALRPGPSLSLPAAEVRSSGETDPLFSAARIELTLPWSSLWRRPPPIERLLIERPELDLDALERWLARRPTGEAAGGIPPFRLEIRDGSVRRHGALLASGIDVDLAHAGELDAWLAGWRQGGALRTLPPLSGRAGVRTIEIDGTRIEGLRLDLQPDTTRRAGPVPAESQGGP